MDHFLDGEDDTLDEDVRVGELRSEDSLVSENFFFEVEHVARTDVLLMLSERPFDLLSIVDRHFYVVR